MLIISLMAQGLLFVVSLTLSAVVTVRTRSVAKGASCLYGLGVLWVLLFVVLVPFALPYVMEIDAWEIAEVFPTQIGIFPVLVLSWIPALVFASLVHLVGIVASDIGAKPDMRASAGLLKRSLYRLLVGTAQSLRRGLTPARDKPYPKWVGVVLGLLLSGAAHFLSGRKRSGLVWYFSILGCGLLSAGLLAVPGLWAFIGACVLCLGNIGLILVMLVKSYRPTRRIGLHGWLVLIVAVACLNAVVKWAARSVVHPFGISTSAMAPTICGVRTEVLDGTSPDASLWTRYLRGRRYIHWKAASAGILDGPRYNQEASPLWAYRVGSDMRWLPRCASGQLEPGRRVAANDLLFSGYIVAGDRVMVEKLTYRFRPPRRGEIVVFRTDGIEDLGTGEYFTFRVAGLPGERVSIDPPCLVINGQRVTEPPLFELMASGQAGYSGYVSSEEGPLDAKESEVVLGEDEYFVLGDNTTNSYDSRYWGPVPRKNIIGRVTRIYWPLDRVDALEGKW